MLFSILQWCNAVYFFKYSLKVFGVAESGFACYIDYCICRSGMYHGYTSDDIDELVNSGFTPDEIEEYMYCCCGGEI